MDNPFILKPYGGKDLFCDREQECRTIVDYLLNGSNVTLISPRRYGKTGLIYRVLDELNQSHPGIISFYVDIYSCNNLDDFIAKLSTAIINSAPKESFTQKFINAIKGVRPIMRFDALSGAPEITITYLAQTEKQETLKSIFDYLSSLKKPIVIAIDEFQQIRNFPEPNMEAILRSHIQMLPNIRFIFSGSQKHIMSEMFTYEKSPFYESTRCIHLEKIDRGIYGEFIRKLFGKDKRILTDEALEFILDWTRVHTHYTQVLCNVLFSMNFRKIGIEEVYEGALKILREGAADFMDRRNLVTPAQWNFLTAVAKEESVSKPTAAEFLVKYNIGQPANSRRILQALLDKELLLETTTLDGKHYSVYNVFLSRWLERLN